MNEWRLARFFTPVLLPEMIGRRVKLGVKIAHELNTGMKVAPGQGVALFRHQEIARFSCAVWANVTKAKMAQSLPNPILNNRISDRWPLPLAQRDSRGLARFTVQPFAAGSVGQAHDAAIFGTAAQIGFNVF